MSVQQARQDVAARDVERLACGPIVRPYAGDEAVRDHHVARLDLLRENVDELAAREPQIAGFLAARHPDPPLQQTRIVRSVRHRWVS